MFRYSWKGKRMGDFTIPPSVKNGKTMVERVMTIDGKDGREFVIARKGELVVGMKEKIKTSSDTGGAVERLSVTRTYQVRFYFYFLHLFIFVIIRPNPQLLTENPGLLIDDTSNMHVPHLIRHPKSNHHHNRLLEW